MILFPLIYYWDGQRNSQGVVSLTGLPTLGIVADL